ncbi:MAG: polymer-forming cytoskeletal protein [Flavobacteriales bacterium]|uniref:bactofilin family protein n=1 Tax=Sanyastnella coralliicola TaxID=3069118 RepID=UPI0027B8FBF2|nr:polymer-forming cytoskeletal protein [Longitalea sp. SCSIO 12813]MCH2197273.1 polymer-forming cytoskeletal protein [Flavobacteriales bacterium]
MLKKDKMARSIDNNIERGINRIVEGTRFKGEVSCESNIRIDGSFEGDLETKGRLVIGPQGSVNGTVRCQNCEVEGKLTGKLGVEELLSLKASAQMEGEIHYGQLSIEPGAKLAGTLHMGSKIKDISSRDEGARAEERTA